MPRLRLQRSNRPKFLITLVLQPVSPTLERIVVSSDTSHSRPPHPEEPTASNSESENPAIDSPTVKAHGPLRNQDWWPEQIDVSQLHRAVLEGQPVR